MRWQSCVKGVRSNSCASDNSFLVSWRSQVCFLPCCCGLVLNLTSDYQQDVFPDRPNAIFSHSFDSGFPLLSSGFLDCLYSSSIHTNRFPYRIQVLIALLNDVCVETPPFHLTLTPSLPSFLAKLSRSAFQSPSLQYLMGNAFCRRPSW